MNNKKNVIIISATSKSNLKLSKDIRRVLMQYLKNVDLINLENYNLPLYTDKKYSEMKKKYLKIIQDLTLKLVKADGIIICSPEYNGSIPPIISNFIAWVSTSTDYWRDAFNEKIGLISTSSGGLGQKFIASMKLQLEHLGMVIVPRNIIVNNKIKFNQNSSEKILKHFIKLL